MYPLQQAGRAMRRLPGVRRIVVSLLKFDLEIKMDPNKYWDLWKMEGHEHILVVLATQLTCQLSCLFSSKIF